MTIQIRVISTIGVALAVIPLPALVSGCSYPGDTSGYKAQATQSRDAITKQIAEVKANPRIPAGVKATALKKLQEDLNKAQ